MNGHFLSKGVELDGRTREYIEKRLQRVEKLVNPVSLLEIEVEKDKKGKFRVEVMVKTPHMLYRAEETTISIEGSIDTVVDELEMQISRDTGKVHDLRRRGARSLKKSLVIDSSARF